MSCGLFAYSRSPFIYSFVWLWNEMKETTLILLESACYFLLQTNVSVRADDSELGVLGEGAAEIWT